MAVVERRNQCDAARFEHGIAEDVARHVADADRRGRLVGRDPDFVEVSQYRLPHAFGGDAHLLMVIAVRAARRERIAQPEAAAPGEIVGKVAERSGAFIGRNDQIGVVRVVAPHSRRTDHARLLDVVGQIEQSRDEELVAGDDFRVDGGVVDGTR